MLVDNQIWIDFYKQIRQKNDFRCLLVYKPFFAFDVIHLKYITVTEFQIFMNHSENNTRITNWDTFELVSSLKEPTW